MPTRFDDALSFVLSWEGGKVDDPADRGGRTNMGITQTTYDAYRRSRGLPLIDVWDAPEQDVKDIYFRDYWAKCQCGALPEPIDLLVFDAAVQHGTKRAAKWLQQALGMSPGECDGIIGQGTMLYVNDAKSSGDIDRVASTYQKCRMAFYDAIVQRDPSQKRFQRGWGNRLTSLSKETRLA